MNYEDLKDIDINKMVAMKVARQRRNSGLPYAVNIPLASGEPPMVRGFDKKSWDQVPGFSDSGELKKFDIFKPKKKAEMNDDSNYQLRIFDPCNSWADAGTIIAEQQISIIFDADSNIDPPAHWVLCRNVDSNGRVSEHYGQPTAPCRSAMIVFLMMQDKK